MKPAKLMGEKRFVFLGEIDIPEQRQRIKSECSSFQ